MKARQLRSIGYLVLGISCLCGRLAVGQATVEGAQNKGETVAAVPVIATPPVVPSMPATNVTEISRDGVVDSKYAKEIWFVRRTPASELVRGSRFVYRGPVVQAVKGIRQGGLLQLLNPFAPAEYGVGEVHWASWDPMYPKGRRPRAFRDPLTDEPVALLVIGR